MPRSPSSLRRRTFASLDVERDVSRLMDDPLYWRERDREFAAHVERQFQRVHGTGAAPATAGTPPVPGAATSGTSRPGTLEAFAPSPRPDDGRLRGDVGRDAGNAPGDVAKVQRLLSASGDYTFAAPRERTGAPSEDLFGAIERFQDRAGLARDGRVAPAGPTIRGLGGFTAGWSPTGSDPASSEDDDPIRTFAGGVDPVDRTSTGWADGLATLRKKDGDADGDEGEGGDEGDEGGGDDGGSNEERCRRLIIQIRATLLDIAESTIKIKERTEKLEEARHQLQRAKAKIAEEYKDFIIDGIIDLALRIAPGPLKAVAFAAKVLRAIEDKHDLEFWEQEVARLEREIAYLRKKRTDEKRRLEALRREYKRFCGEDAPDSPDNAPPTA